MNITRDLLARGFINPRPTTLINIGIDPDRFSVPLRFRPVPINPLLTRLMGSLNVTNNI